MDSDDPILDDQEESDIHTNDEGSEDDYYNVSNINYANAYPLPQIECPKMIINTHQSNYAPRLSTIISFREFTEKLISFINPSINAGYNDQLADLNNQKIFDNYQITFTNSFDYRLSKYDIFSKNHHRVKLYDVIYSIDWNKEYKITESKKETNPYEEVYEKYFDKHLSYKLANLNYLFGRELLVYDRIMNYTPILLVGDNGGLTDYIQWYSILNGFTSKVFVFPERNNSIATAKYRREIKSKDNIKILNEFFTKCDLDETKGISSALLTNIANRVMEEVEYYGVNLYIARKVIKFQKEQSQEMLNRNFMLANMILAFETLNREGTFIMKLYDTFSLFTISLIYILYKLFEKVTIIKPFSSRPYSASRYIVCEKFITDKPKILDYLKNFFDKYLEILKQGIDVPFVIPISEVSKDENLTSRLLEINSMITEGRINELMEIHKHMSSEMIMRYDKMDIKKHCLDLWKVPVLNYDESKLVKNQPHQKNNQLKNKPKTIEETAQMYKDFGKYSKATEDLVNLLGGGFDKDKEEDDLRKSNEVKGLPYEKKLTDKEKDEQFAKIFPKKVKTSKPKKKEETQKLIQSKRKRLKEEEPLSHRKEDKTHSKHKKDNNDYSTKEYKFTNNEDAWKEAITNRKKLEEKKVPVDESIKTQLLQYKKNK